MFARKMLLHSPLHDKTPAQQPLGNQFNTAITTKIDTSESFDFNNIMLFCFSGFLCLLVFSICIRCLLKCLIWITNQIHQANNLNNKVVVRSGVDKKALNSIPKVKYSKKMKKIEVGFISTECVICLYEFKEGERVRILPKCNHSFHVKCIDLWLKSHFSCPTCRQSLVDTCQILIGSHCDDHTSSSSSSASLSSTSISASTSASTSSRELNGDSIIEPLEREDFVRI